MLNFQAASDRTEEFHEHRPALNQDRFLDSLHQCLCNQPECDFIPSASEFPITAAHLSLAIGPHRHRSSPTLPVLLRQCNAVGPPRVSPPPAITHCFSPTDQRRTFVEVTSVGSYAASNRGYHTSPGCIHCIRSPGDRWCHPSSS